jgi:hypothetical protein
VKSRIDTPACPRTQPVFPDGLQVDGPTIAAPLRIFTVET